MLRSTMYSTDSRGSRITSVVRQSGNQEKMVLVNRPGGVQDSSCFTIAIPGQDRFYSWVNSTARCLNFLRSQTVCREKVRQQYNEITSYIDASNVYGSEQEHSAILRTYR